MRNIIRKKRSVRAASARKRRVTVSLSAESVQFLNDMRSETTAPSVSAVVERIIEDLQGRAELDRVDAQLRAHYDSRPAAAGQEDRNWGAVGEQALASMDEERVAPRAVNER